MTPVNRTGVSVLEGNHSTCQKVSAYLNYVRFVGTQD